jgi:transposase
VEIVARDRAGVYADGIRQGAPDAIQVADRWHLLRNLSDAVQAVAGDHDAAVRRIATEMAAEPAAGVPTAVTPAIEGPNAAATPRGPAAHAGRRARFEEAVRLHAAGVSLRQTARRLGTDGKTVRRWLRAGDIPSWHQPRRGSMLDAHRDHLERRWTEGCHNAARLWRELASEGFAGGYTTVKAWAAQRRTAGPGVGRIATADKGQPWRLPSGRRVARLLMTGADTLAEADQTFVARLLDAVPPLAATVATAQRLSLLLRRQSSETLEDVLTAASATPLASFTAALRKDIDAVQAALDLPWTTSPVEGQIGRIKMLKRTMYGRAGFKLLRARVLDAA